MKKVCYYVADDGTKFNTESECSSYEFKRKIKSIVGKELKLFDENYKEITDYAFNSVYDASAVQVLTIEGAKFLVQWADDYGIDAPFDFYDIENKDEDLLGNWVYDEFDPGSWTHLDILKRKVDELYFALQ